MTTQPRRLARWASAWPALAIALGAFLAHAGNLRNGFTNWDDPGYIVDNPLIREASLSAAAGLFTRFYYNDYYPLNQLSYLVDHALWGLDPMGYHLTNVVLHALSAALAWLIAVRLVGSRWLAAIAAVTFAVHPVNVESVAWLSERKNVLSMALFLVAFLLYLERDRRPTGGRWWIFGSLLAFVAACLAKSIVTPFPALLVAYDVLMVPDRWRKRWLEKVPFFAVSAAVAILTVMSQGEAGAIPPYIGRNALNNLWTMLGVYLTYLRMLALPLWLNARYASTYLLTPFSLRVGLGLLAVVGLLLVAWRHRRRQPLVGFAVVWFFLTLLPVSHIIPTSVLYADRYLYHPTLALGWVLALGVGRLARRNRTAAIVAFSALAVLWTAGTVRRTADWRDSVTLWESSIAVDDDNFFAHAILGDAYLRVDRIDDAIRSKERGLELAPKWRHSHLELVNTGLLHYAKGNLDRADQLFGDARELTPTYGPAYKGLGLVAVKRKRYRSAAYYFLTAYANGTDDQRIQDGLLVALTHLGQPERFDRFLQDPAAEVAAEAASHIAEAKRLEAAGDVRFGLARMVMASRLVPRDGSVRREVDRLTRLRDAAKP